MYIILASEGITQWVTCLPCKHQSLNSDPSCEKQGVVVHTYSQCWGSSNGRISGEHWPTRAANQ